jgi:hypothetical protein
MGSWLFEFSRMGDVIGEITGEVTAPVLANLICGQRGHRAVGGGG